MRIVGYVRERPPADDAEPAFAQGERIRRWADDHGHHLIAVCQDNAATTPEAPGFRALLGIVDTGAAEAVVVASLAALGDDIPGQEVRLWELRNHGIQIRSTTTADTSPIEGSDGDATREAARNVLDRLTEHHRSMESR